MSAGGQGLCLAWWVHSGCLTLPMFTGVIGRATYKPTCNLPVSTTLFILMGVKGRKRVKASQFLPT